MKKLTLLLLTILIAAFAIGCGGEKEKEVRTVTLWHYYNADIKTQFDTLVQIFNETVGREKGILVDAYSLGGVNELADAVYAAANKDLGAKEMPDIFAAYSDSALRLDQLGVVASYDEYFSKDELARYNSDFIEDGRIGDDNKLKIIPIAKSTELLFLNMTSFKEFAEATGVELTALSTWEGIVDTAEKYYEWSDGKAFFGIDSMSNYMIVGMKQLGEDIFHVKEGKAALNLSRENAKKLWECFYVPYIKGYYTAMGRFRSDDVKSGNIMMFTGSSSSASFFPTVIETGKDSSYETEPKVLPYPYFEGKDKVCVQQGAGMVMTKSSEETEEACVEFLKWFTAPEQNATFAVETSYLPVENAALSHEATLKELGTSEELDIRVQTSKALYEMLDSYTLYAAKPFDKSFNARTTLNDSLVKCSQDDFAELTKKVKAGEKKEALLENYCSEENFDRWYTSITEELATILE